MAEYSEELDGMLMTLKGEVSYVAAFPNTFVTHTEEEARATAAKFAPLGRTLAVYRIEIVDVIEPPVEEPKEKA